MVLRQQETATLIIIHLMLETIYLYTSTIIQILVVRFKRNYFNVTKHVRHCLIQHVLVSNDIKK